MLSMPAKPWAGPVVNSLLIFQFRLDFPRIAARLDSMRQKLMTEGSAGGSEA